MQSNWKEIHAASVVIDGHMDTLSLIHSQSAYGQGTKRSLAQGAKDGHVDLGRLASGGVTAAILATYVQPPFVAHLAKEHVLQMIGYAHNQVSIQGDRLMLIKKASDVTKAKKSGKIGIILGMEGGEAIGKSFETLRSFYELGVRNIGLTWNHRNQIGAGPWEPGGLSLFGKELIKEMNRLGILVDISHLNIDGFWDVMKESSKPPIASHSNARALTDHPRNLHDDQIKALAEKGGLMGMNFCAAFLNRNEANTALRDVLDHIDHIAGLVGTDCIALGSDFDGITAKPKELGSVKDMPLVTKGLVQRGYGESDITKILGGNYLRVFKSVW
jgi:membrane dipeptidase